MDRPLSTWPSITQYDDFYCAGLGDIDPLESPDQSFDNSPGTSLSDSQENKPSPPSADTAPDMETLAQTSHTQGGDLYRLRSSDSLAVARWESINAVDLDSVLDSTLPSQDASTTSSGENMYDLYGDGILNEVNEFMSDSMSEGAHGRRGFRPCESLQMTASSTAPDMVSIPSCQEDIGCRNAVVDGDTAVLFNVPQPSISKPAINMGDHSAQPYSYNPMSRAPCISSHNPLDLKESIFSQQMFDIQTSRAIQWPNMTSTCMQSQAVDGEVHHSPLHVRDNHQAIMEQQVMLADAVRVELRRTRAQASRARRLAASQRRTKKYPCQKHIRMSSASTGARDRLDQKLAGASAPLRMVSQGQSAPGILPLNSQFPGFLPVLQSPHLASGHGKLPSAPMALSQSTNSMECLDTAVLEKLQTMLCKMNVDIRLCIRDALYRLANSSKHRQSKMDFASVSSLSHSNEVMETNTNPIDRWIVSILFCKQPTSFQLDPRLYVHTLTQAAAPMNSSFHQWNSCGSSVSLQEGRRHLLKGL